MEAPRWIDATAVRRAVPPDRARRLVRQVLADGFDPADDPARLSPVVPGGQLLIMPSSTPRASGVKVLSVAPDNPDRGLERIQALYVLFDPDTLAPSVILDGTAITALRTPAVSAVAIDALAPAGTSSVVVFGSGPQAVGHVEAILEIRRPEQVTIVGRGLERARAAAQQVSALGVAASALPADDAHVAEVVADSAVVITATSSASPVLDGEWVADGACVVAIGSHEPDRRELDSRLVGRSLVVVEDVATARREAGDVILAAAQGALDWADVCTLSDVVTGRVARATDRPNVFKSVGMAWQDLVIAEHIGRV